MSSLSVAQGEAVVNIPVQARALKSLFTVMRKTNTIQVHGTAALNTLIPEGCTEYSYLIGSERYPPTRLQVAIAQTDLGGNCSGAYMSVMGALGQQNSLHARCLVSSPELNTTHFVMGVDVEKYQNQGGMVAETGIDTLDNNLNVSLEVNVNVQASVSRTDSYALKQVLFHVDGNGSFSVSR